MTMIQQILKLKCEVMKRRGRIKELHPDELQTRQLAKELADCSYNASEADVYEGLKLSGGKIFGIRVVPR